MARGKAPKNTVCGTKEGTKKKHDLEHATRRAAQRDIRAKESNARWKAAKNAILCTKENTQNNLRSIFWLATAIKTDEYFYIRPEKTPFYEVPLTMSKHAMTRVKTKSNDLKTQTVENYTTVCRTGANAGYSYSYNIHHIHSANYFSEPQLQLQPRHQLQLQLQHQGQVPATTPIAPTNRSNPRATAITRPTATACHSYFYATD